jgi:hypothetical protein
MKFNQFYKTKDLAHGHSQAKPSEHREGGLMAHTALMAHTFPELSPTSNPRATMRAFLQAELRVRL